MGYHVTALARVTAPLPVSACFSLRRRLVVRKGMLCIKASHARRMVMVCCNGSGSHLLAVAYPWTFYLDGNNAAVLDVELLGAWNGINATLAHRSRPAAHRRPYPRVPGEYPWSTP